MKNIWYFSVFLYCPHRIMIFMYHEILDTQSKQLDKTLQRKREVYKDVWVVSIDTRNL